MPTGARRGHRGDACCGKLQLKGVVVVSRCITRKSPGRVVAVIVVLIACEEACVVRNIGGATIKCTSNNINRAHAESFMHQLSRPNLYARCSFSSRYSTTALQPGSHMCAWRRHKARILIRRSAPMPGTAPRRNALVWHRAGHARACILGL